LAFSSIAQAGYLLIPLATRVDLNNIIYYLFAYLLANLGIFTIITIATKEAGTDDIKSISGLYHRSPLLGVAMSLFLFSLAGLPVTAGFIGKFNIFLNAVSVGSFWLAITMLLTSVISYYYYFNLIRQMYMRPGQSEARLKVPYSLQLVILVTFLGVLLIGLMPNIVYDFIGQYDILGSIFDIGFSK